MVKEGKLGLSLKIFIALILGILFGYFFPKLAVSIKLFGDMFIRLIKMIVVPLIVSTLIVGIAGIDDYKKMGRIGLKAIIWFEVATTLALFIGLAFANIIKPGIGVTLPKSLTVITNLPKSIGNLTKLFTNIVPSNFIDAMARGDMLQIIIFSTFFGISLAAIGEKGKLLYNITANLADVMFKLTHYIMYFAPYGVFALSAYTIGQFGIKILMPLSKLIFSLYLAISIFILIISFLAAWIFKFNLISFFKKLKEPILLSFTTASSEAAMPLTMKKLEEFGIPKYIISFVLPAGYSFNLDGSTLYCSLTTLFLTQVYGIHMTFTQQILMLGMFMISSKGIAGVPGASLIVIAGIAGSFGIPLEGIGIIFGIDRIMDMARTVCNLVGNCIAALVVAKWEKV